MMTTSLLDPSQLISALPAHIEELTLDLAVAQEHQELLICREE